MGHPPPPVATPTTTSSRPSRAEVIATLHAVADWFAEHPEIPMPQDVIMTHRTAPADEPDEQTRVDAVTRWGIANDAAIKRGVLPFQPAVTATLPIVASSTGRGIRVTYCRTAMPGGVRR